MYGSNEVTSRPAPRALQKREARVKKRKSRVIKTRGSCYKKRV